MKHFFLNHNFPWGCERTRLQTFSRLLCMLAFAVILSAAAAGESPIVIEHVTVVNVGDGSLLRDMTVVIAGDRISAVSPSTQAKTPEGAEREVPFDLGGEGETHG